MYCPKCGKENNDDAKFCQECGFNLQDITVEKPNQSLDSKNDISLSEKKIENEQIKKIDREADKISGKGKKFKKVALKIFWACLAVVFVIILISYIYYKENYNIPCYEFLEFSEAQLLRGSFLMDEFHTTVTNNSKDITVNRITIRIDFFDKEEKNINLREIDIRNIDSYLSMYCDIPPKSTRMMKGSISKEIIKNLPSVWSWRWQILDARGYRK